MRQQATDNAEDDPVAEAILELLHARQAGASICPSEVARAAAEDWRPLMPAVRASAQRLARRGLIDVTQGEALVDALGAKGPIRLRLRGDDAP